MTMTGLASRVRAFATAALATALVVSSRRAQADDGAPVTFVASVPPGSPAPPGTRWSSKPHDALIETGGALFFLSYGPSFAIGSAGSSNLLDSDGAQTRWLFLPFAGPFVLAGELHDRIATALLVGDGAVQIAGVGLAVAGLLWRTPRLVPVGVAGRRAKLALAPFFGGAGSGATVGIGVRGGF
jgi:hypothetical protein